jgi:hypothetical protein
MWAMKKVPTQGSTTETNILGDVVEGIKFTLKTPVVLSVIGMGFAFGLFGAAHIQILPAFAKDVLNLDAAGAGLLLSAAGAGSLVINLWPWHRWETPSIRVCCFWEPSSCSEYP